MKRIARNFKLSSTTGIRGNRIDPNIIIGNQYKGFASGTILDANAIFDVISEIQSGSIGKNAVTSWNIKDGSILLRDLNNEILQYLGLEYDEETETLKIGGTLDPSDFMEDDGGNGGNNSGSNTDDNGGSVQNDPTTDSGTTNGEGNTQQNNDDPGSGDNSGGGAGDNQNTPNVDADGYVTDDEIDFGLPSGTIWATRNVGAEDYLDSGYYFSWGNVEPSDTFTSESYTGTDGQSLTGNIPQNATYDAAVKLGLTGSNEQWRMPTISECEELMNSCDSIEKVQKGGKYGIKLTKNGISMFLPLAGAIMYGDNNPLFDEAGYYWISQADPNEPTGQGSLMGYNDGNLSIGGNYKWLGLPIRPVKVVQP